MSGAEGEADDDGDEVLEEDREEDRDAAMSMPTIDIPEMMSDEVSMCKA